MPTTLASSVHRPAMDQYLSHLSSRLTSSYSASLSADIASHTSSCKAVISRAGPVATRNFQEALEAHGHVIAKVLDRPIYGWTANYRGASSYYDEKPPSLEAETEIVYNQPPVNVRAEWVADPVQYRDMGLEDAVEKIARLTSDAQATATKIGFYEINGGMAPEPPQPPQPPQPPLPSPSPPSPSPSAATSADSSYSNPRPFSYDIEIEEEQDITEQLIRLTAKAQAALRRSQDSHDGSRAEPFSSGSPRSPRSARSPQSLRRSLDASVAYSSDFESFVDPPSSFVDPPSSFVDPPSSFVDPPSSFVDPPNPSNVSVEIEDNVSLAASAEDPLPVQSQSPPRPLLARPPLSKPPLQARTLDVWASHNFAPAAPQPTAPQPAHEQRILRRQQREARCRSQRARQPEPAAQHALRDSTKEEVAARIMRMARMRRDARNKAK